MAGEESIEVTVKRPHAEFLALLRERFGESPANWAFVCPGCGDVATGADLKAALAEHPRTRNGKPVNAADLLGQECIGRTLGALSKSKKYTGRGCDWCAYGLFRGPEFVVMEDGREVASFAIAGRMEASVGGVEDEG